MAHGAEFLARRGADALGGRVGRGQLGMIGLERFEPAHQAIVFGVGNLGIVEDVVAVVVMVNLLAKLFDLRLQFVEIALH